MISFTAASTFKHDLSGVVSGHIGDHFSRCGIHDHCAFRHFKDHIRPVCSMTAALAPFFAIFCFIFSSVAVVAQGILTFVDLKDHIAALSTIAAVRAAIGNIQLTAKAYMPIAALS